MSSLNSHHCDSLFQAVESIEAATTELFDVAQASLFVAEAFGRQLLQLQQGKESDYLAYIIGQADKPTAGGSIAAQMQQLETVLSTGTGYLVEAGEASVNVALDKFLSVRGTALAAAEFIAEEESRAGSVADAAMQELQARHDEEKKELLRLKAESDDAVAAAGAATAAMLPIRAAQTREVAVQAPPTTTDAAAVAAAAVSVSDQEENSDEQQQQQQQDSSSSATAVGGTAVAAEDEHKEVQDADSPEKDATPANSPDTKDAVEDTDVSPLQPKKQEQERTANHFDAAGSLSQPPLVRADAWFKSPTKWGGGSAGRSVSHSLSPSSRGGGGGAVTASYHHHHQQQQQYRYGSVGSTYSNNFTAAAAAAAAAAGSSSSYQHHYAGASPDVVAPYGLGRSHSAAVVPSTRWNPNSPSSHNHSRSVSAFAAINNNDVDPEAGLTEEQKEERRQRREKIISVVESERFEPKDIDWGRSVTADPYRYGDTQEVWAQPWRRYEEKQRQRHEQMIKEEEELILEQQRRSQSQQQQRHAQSTSPEVAMVNPNAFLGQQQQHLSPMSRNSNSEEQQQQQQQQQPNTSRHPASNTAAAAPPPPPAAAEAESNPPVDNAPAPENFVHPADLLRLRAKDAEAAAQAYNNINSHNLHPEEPLSAARGSLVNSAADSYGALGSMKAGEAQAIVAVASGSAPNESYAVETALGWLMRTSHGPMLNLEQSLLQRDFSEKGAPGHHEAIASAKKKQQEEEEQQQRKKQREEEEAAAAAAAAEDEEKRRAEDEAAAAAAAKKKKGPASPLSPSKLLGKKMPPGGKPPMAVKTPVGVKGKLQATPTAASATAAKKSLPVAGKTAAAAPPGRLRGKSLVQNSSMGSRPGDVASSSRQSAGAAAAGADSATNASSAAAVEATNASRLDAAALSRLHQTAGRADPVGEYQKQQIAGAFVGIHEEQQQQEQEKLQRSQAELSASGKNGGATATRGSVGQIVEDEDEAMKQLERNSDYNPQVAADAASHRSHETESLKQIHHLLGGVQASMIRDAGAPPLDPDEIDDSGTPKRRRQHAAAVEATGGGGSNTGAADQGTGVLHALHRVLKEEGRSRSSQGQ